LGALLNSIIICTTAVLIMSAKDNLQIPRLESLSKSKVVSFQKHYDEYVRDVEAMNRNKTVQQRINIRKISECIDQELLDEILEKLQLSLSSPNLDIKIMEFLNTVLSKNNFDAQKLRLAEDLKKITLDSSMDDAEARVLCFKKELRRFLKENGMNPTEIC
jgi:hypothetical protein